MQIKSNELIVNASYRDFFAHAADIPRVQYPTSTLEELDVLKSVSFSAALALFLQNCDADNRSIYGIEIKANGGSRSGRIPLVRVSGKNASIWKISSAIEDLEKTATILDGLVYFLDEHNDVGYSIPSKVVVLRGGEDRFAISGSVHYQFVRDMAQRYDLTIFSLEFIKRILSGVEAIDLDYFLLKRNYLFTVLGSI